jgi:N-dimethylarginine dimethylaminohydrolase
VLDEAAIITRPGAPSRRSETDTIEQARPARSTEVTSFVSDECSMWV